MEALNARLGEMENQRQRDHDQINQLQQDLQQAQQQQQLQLQQQQQQGQQPEGVVGQNDNQNRADQNVRHDQRNQDNMRIQSMYEMARNQAEKRITSLPNLTANETEAVKSFIRQATHIWNSIDNEDLVTFMRIIKDKVIGCTWLPEIEIDEAVNWPQIRRLLEEKWREETNPEILRANISGLQQKVGETVLEFARRTQKILTEYEQYHGKITQSHREEFEDRIREKFETGLLNKYVREAVIAHANTSLKEAVQVATRLQTRQEQLPQLKEIICNYCDRRGHREAECRLKQKRLQQSNDLPEAEKTRFCMRCNTAGHSLRTCFVASYNNSNDNHYANYHSFNYDGGVDVDDNSNKYYEDQNYIDENFFEHTNEHNQFRYNNRSEQNYNNNRRDNYNNNQRSNNYINDSYNNNNNNNGNYNDQSNYSNRSNYNDNQRNYNGNCNNGSYRSNNQNYRNYQQAMMNQHVDQNNNANGFNTANNQNEYWNKNSENSNQHQQRNQNATATAFGAYITPAPIPILRAQFPTPISTNQFIPLYNRAQINQNQTDNQQNMNNQSEN